MTALSKQRYTLEEYIEFDKQAEGRFEYFDGEVFDMAGGSPSHTRISVDTYYALQRKLEGSQCEVFNAEMRVFVPKALPYRYPDVSVCCGEAHFDEVQGQERLTNPLLIVEVLSPSTEAYDLGRKFTAYQSIPSLREYILIAQAQPLVIQHVRQTAGQWVRRDLEGLDNQLSLDSIQMTLTFAEIYRRVSFPPPADSTRIKDED
jgi:Uma2 family endonuclease